MPKAGLAAFVALVLLQPVRVDAQASGALTPLDYLEIEQLYSRLSLALDTGNAEQFAAGFAPDGRLEDETGTVYEGRERLMDAARRQTDRTARHYLWNIRITPSAQGAAGSAYAMIARLPVAGTEGRPPTVLANGQYRDVFVKTPDGWRLRSREFHESPAGGGGGATPPQPAPGRQ